MILVTGSNGFAGSHLVDYLRLEGHDVRCFRGDIRDYHTCLKQTEDVDLVFHLAAITSIEESRIDPFLTCDTNTTGTLNLLEACRKNEVEKIVYASTCHVYGNQAEYPIKESALPCPIDIYSASKLSSENICNSYCNTYGMNISITRAFNHYGERQKSTFLIPYIISNILKNKIVYLRNKNYTRDFTYVEDIIKAYNHIGHLNHPNLYHICSGKELSLEYIFNVISKEIGKGEVEWTNPKREADIERSVGVCSYGIQIRTSFEDGIRKTVEWMRKVI